MKPPSLKTILFILIILGLVLFAIMQERRAQKITQSALALAELAQFRAGLSAYFSERAAYPEGEKIVIGSVNAQAICVAAAPDQNEGLVSGKDGCANGKILFSSQETGISSPFVYTSTGPHYEITFALAHSLGAFREKGAYCATENGILVGECGR